MVRETRADRFASSAKALYHESPMLAAQALGDWLTLGATKQQLEQDGLAALCAADSIFRRVMLAANIELIAAANIQARTTLLLRALLPFLRVVRDEYYDVLSREIVPLSKKPANVPLIQRAVSNWLFWIGRCYVARFLLEPLATKLPWHEIRPTTMFAFELNAGRGASPQQADADLVRLQRQIARLVLISRSISPDMQGRQLLIADLVADNLSEFTRISMQHSEETPFGHMPNDDSPPTVLSLLNTRVGARQPGLYFGLDRSLQELIGLEYDIKMRNTLPDMLNPRGLLNVAEVLVVIKHLKNRWSGKKMRRLSERRPLTGKVTVAYEFETVRRQIERVALSDSALRLVECNIEPGEIADASLNGLGMKLTRHLGWLKVGQVLGIRVDSDTSWRIGMVKRATLAGQREMFAGVQMLGRNPEAIKLRLKGAISHLDLAARASDATKDAIYISPSTTSVPHPLLICADNSLERGKVYHASLHEGAQDLRIVDIEDIGSNCVIYRAQVAESIQ